MPSTPPSPLSTIQARDELLQRFRRKSVEMRNDHGFVGAKTLFVRSLRRAKRNADDRHRFGAAVAGTLLDLAEFPAYPAFVCGTVEDEHTVAGTKVFVVVVANFSFVAFEYGTYHFDVLLKQIIDQSRGSVGIASVVDDIEPWVSCRDGGGSGSLLRRCVSRP